MAGGAPSLVMPIAVFQFRDGIIKKTRVLVLCKYVISKHQEMEDCCARLPGFVDMDGYIWCGVVPGSQHVWLGVVAWIAHCHCNGESFAAREHLQKWLLLWFPTFEATPLVWFPAKIRPIVGIELIQLEARRRQGRQLDFEGSGHGPADPDALGSNSTAIAIVTWMLHQRP